MWRTPILEGLDVPAPAAPAEIASVEPTGAESPAAPKQAADDADNSNIAFGGPAQTADSRYGGPFHGLLNSVFQVKKGLAR